MEIYTLQFLLNFYVTRNDSQRLPMTPNDSQRLPTTPNDSQRLPTTTSNHSLLLSAISDCCSCSSCLKYYFSCTHHPYNCNHKPQAALPSGTEAEKRLGGRHALTVSGYRGLTWTMSMIPMNAALVVCGSMLESNMHHHYLSQTHKWLLAMSIGTMSMCTLLQQTLHKGELMSVRVVKKEYRFAFRFVMSVLIATLPAWGWEETFLSTAYFITAIIVLIVTLVFVVAVMKMVKTDDQIVAESIRKLQAEKRSTNNPLAEKVTLRAT